MSVHFSSSKLDWATPHELYDRLDRIYAFDLDVAASSENACCPAYFDQSANGLTQSWAHHRVWCNPPYGRHIGEWTRKAAQEAESAILIVMLVPARTDTAWWHEAIRSARIKFLRGRLKFQGATSAAPFPSALLFWNC